MIIRLSRIRQEEDDDCSVMIFLVVMVGRLILSSANVLKFKFKPVVI